MADVIENHFRAHLAADSGVSALAGARIYPLRLPDGPTYPAITYERVSATRDFVLAGPGGRVNPRLRVHCWAETYAEAVALADAVRQAVNGHTGAMDGERVDHAELLSDNDLYEPDTRKYRRVLDFTLSHIE